MIEAVKTDTQTDLPLVKVTGSAEPEAKLSAAAVQATAGFRPVLDAVRQAQARHGLFAAPNTHCGTTDAPVDMPVDNSTGIPVIVGVSGGADSLCLLFALAALAEAWHLTLHVAHLDHTLRPTSADDAAHVRAVAAHLNLPYYEAQLARDALTQDASGLEAAARRARYTFLGQVAAQVAQQTPLGLPVTVAVGHHQDDQAETLLMHLIGGSGLDGLAGMRWVTQLPYCTDARVRLVRPLLGVDRAAIHDAMHALGVTWCEDATNDDTTHLRNQLRHAILPQLAQINPNIAATLARSAGLLAAEADRAAANNQAALDAVQLEQTAQRLVIDLDQLLTHDLATQRGVLQMGLDHLCIDRRDVGAEAIDNLLERSRQQASGGPYPLLGEWRWLLLGADGHTPRRLSLHTVNALPLLPDQPLLTPGIHLALPTEGTLDVGDGWCLSSRVIAADALPSDWRTPGQPWRAYLDAAAADNLVLTTVQPGMRIAPLGLRGHHRSVGDLLTDHKIAPALRPHWPVVCTPHTSPQQTDSAADAHSTNAVERADEPVVWVCGLRLGHPYRVQSTSAAIRLLQWTRTPQEATG